MGINNLGPRFGTRTVATPAPEPSTTIWYKMDQSGNQPDSLNSETVLVASPISGVSYYSGGVSGYFVEFDDEDGAFLSASGDIFTNFFNEKNRGKTISWLAQLHRETSFVLKDASNNELLSLTYDFINKTVTLVQNGEETVVSNIAIQQSWHVFSLQFNNSTTKLYSHEVETGAILIEEDIGNPLTGDVFTFSVFGISLFLSEIRFWDGLVSNDQIIAELTEG